MEDILDKADEKMLPVVEKSKLIKNDDVKILSNGETKLDVIDDLKLTFTGLAKEELVKYAKDPFWIRLRWVLFILFWVTWFLMLFGAIGIIMSAEKCAAPEPTKWWQQGPLIELESAHIKSEVLKKLKKDGIGGIIINPATVKLSEDLNKNEFDAYDIDLIDKFSAKLELIKENNLNVIVDLNPVSTNKWLNQSINKEGNYTNYYYWASSKNDGPPNNWKSPIHGSAWSFSNARGAYYLSQFQKAADLNFHNQLVVKEFSRVVEKWLKAGVNGIRLIGTDKLLVDPFFPDESLGNGPPGVTHDDYEFYSHKFTKNLDSIANVLFQWKLIIANETNSQGILTIKEDLESLQPYKLNETLVINLPRHSKLFNFFAKPADALTISKGLDDALVILEQHWPAWEYNPDKSMPEDVLNLLIMPLPGTPIIKYKTISEQNNQTTSNINHNLVKLRSTQSVLNGDFKKFLFANNTIFAYTREKSGSPSYLTVCNPSATEVVVDFSVVNSDIVDLTPYVLSNNFNNSSVKEKIKIFANAVTIPPKSAAIFTYAV